MTVRAVYTTTDQEPVVVMHGRVLPSGTPVIFCHGYGIGALQAFAVEGHALRVLADVYEVPSAAADLSGTSTWGQDDSVDAVDSVISWMGTNYSTSTSRVALCGTSMGGLTVLNWAMRNPTKVAGIALTIPAVDLESFHDRDPLGLGGAIETAYGDEAGYLAALPDHDPCTPDNLGKLRELGPVTRIWYSTDDPVCAASEIEAYAGQTGSALTGIGAVGHSVDAGSWAAVAKFLDARV